VGRILGFKRLLKKVIKKRPQMTTNENSEPIYLNLLTDFGFKKIFGEENSKEILIDFLNEILRPKGIQLGSIYYQNTELIGKQDSVRSVFFDLYCKTSEGEDIIVEIQRASQLYFKDRTVAYASAAIQKQTQKRKDWNYQLRPVYLIAIMDFAFKEEFGLTDKLLNYVQLTDLESGNIFYQKLLLVYLKIGKFTKTEEELETHFDKWLYLIRNLGQLQEIPIQLKESIFMSVMEKAKVGKLSKSDRFLYDQSLKAYRDNYAALETARYEGKVENTQEIAINLINLGASLELISQATGLCVEEIEKLK